MSISTQRRRLNNIRFTDDRIEIIKEYVKNKTFPNDFPNYKVFEIKKQFNTDKWKVETRAIELLKKNKKDTERKNVELLIYKPLNLLVVENDYKQSFLDSLYSDLSVSLGKGIHTFYDAVTNKYLNITRKEVAEFLRRQGNFQITRRSPAKKDDEKIIGLYPNHIWMMDIMFMDYTKEYNYSGGGKGKNRNYYRYILNIIDVFSKKLWSFPILDGKKTAREVWNKLRSVIRSENARPKLLVTDNGAEFQGIFSEQVKKEKLRLLYGSPYESTNQGVIERVNSTLRSKIRNLFIPQSFNHVNLNWEKQIKLLLENYNNQRTESTKFTPNELWWKSNKRLNVNLKDSLSPPPITDQSTQEDKIKYVVYQNLKKSAAFIKNKKKFNFKIDDEVRVLMKVFYKDVREQFKSLDGGKKVAVTYTPEIYIITGIRNSSGMFKRPSYTLKSKKTGRDVLNETERGLNLSKVSKIPKKQFFGSQLMLVPENSSTPSVQSIEKAVKINTGN